MDDEAGGVVAAHQLPPVVDAVGRGLENGVRVVDRRELTPIQEKAGTEWDHCIVRMQLTGGGSWVAAGDG